MRNFRPLFILLLLSISASMYAQVGVNTTGASPDNSAILDASSTTKGVLISRMSTSQRDAITSPAPGLQIYNTDCHNFNFYDGSRWIAINTNDNYMPATPGAITGSASVCANTSGLTYSIASVGGATSYLWSVPAGSVITGGQGTTSITVTFGNTAGNINVTESNACGTSSPSALAVTVNSSPATPGAISGFTNAIPGQAATITYSISPVTNATSYNWTLPTGMGLLSGQGSTSIIVKDSCNAVSGNISVTSQGACGTSSPNTLAITMSRLIADAGSAAIAGPSTIIGGSPTASLGQSPYSYSWGPSSGLSNSGASNPTAQCGGPSTTYIVTVTDNNTCTATSSVAVSRVFADAGLPKSTICSSQTLGGSPVASGGAGSYSYAWGPSTGISSATNIANPTDTALIVTTYTVTVTDGNSCTATSSVTVNQSQVFAYNGGNPQATTFTVPAGVSCIYIQAYGSAGTSGFGNGPGYGAIMQGMFSVNAGDVFNVEAGGASGYSNGGGGSWVWNSTSALYGSGISSLLIVAGGGGGGGQGGGDGQAGSGYVSPSGAGGGGGGGSNSGGGGGCGWLSNGTSGGGSGGVRPLAGGTTGGGGFSNDGAGAGGGYTGGTGGHGWNGGNRGGGGGGSSYNIGTHQINIGGTNNTTGQVIINY